MNWTGGRLQRHSRSNANQTTKLQKQHFARARLELSAEATDHNHREQILLDAPKTSRFSGVVERGHTIPSSSTAHRPYVQDNVKIKQLTSQSLEQIKLPSNLESQSSPQLLLTRPNNLATFAEFSEPKKHTSAGRSTKLFERTRRILLDQADWSGISAARPLNIAFPPQQEMHRSGGHQRNEIRKRADMQDVGSLISRSGSITEPRYESHKADSVRIVPYRNVRKAPEALSTNNSQSQIFSSESDLSESGALTGCLQLEHCQSLTEKHDLPEAVQTLSSVGETNSAADRSSEHRLLLLSDARDCTNFDEIREKSSQYSSRQTDHLDENLVHNEHESWLKRVLGEDFNGAQKGFRAPPTPVAHLKARRPQLVSGIREIKRATDQNPMQYQLYSPRLADQFVHAPAKTTPHLQDRFRSSQRGVIGSVRRPLVDSSSYDTQETADYEYARSGIHQHKELDDREVPYTPKLPRSLMPLWIEHGHSQLKRKAVADDLSWGSPESVASSSPNHRRPLMLDVEHNDFAQSSRRFGTAFDPYNCVLPGLNGYDGDAPGARTAIEPEQHGTNLSSGPRTPFAEPGGTISMPRIAPLLVTNDVFAARFDDTSSIVGSADKALLRSDLRSSSSIHAISNLRSRNSPSSYARTCGTRHSNYAI